MIQAVIFDMDGVLFDTERLMKEGWKRASEKMHFTLTEEHLKYMRGNSKERSAALFQKWFDGKIDYYQGRVIRSQYLEEYIAKHSIPKKKGLDQLLDYLKKESIPWAIATSTERERACHYWDLAGITSQISASVCGNEVTAGKPDPEIFLTAAAKLGISPENCLIVEDSINGLKAARAAGGITCMIPDLTPYTPDLKPICDYVCENLADCISILSPR